MEIASHGYQRLTDLGAFIRSEVRQDCQGIIRRWPMLSRDRSVRLLIDWIASVVELNRWAIADNESPETTVYDGSMRRETKRNVSGADGTGFATWTGGDSVASGKTTATSEAVAGVAAPLVIGSPSTRMAATSSTAPATMDANTIVGIQRRNVGARRRRRVGRPPEATAASGLGCFGHWTMRPRSSS
ncbi:MAG: hypothetical protein HW416_927 [Chloroflexi bacterium]|nr:hypothetical protein [Chloroflexota bacterium]